MANYDFFSLRYSLYFNSYSHVIGGEIPAPAISSLHKSVIRQ